MIPIRYLAASGGLFTVAVAVAIAAPPNDAEKPGDAEKAATIAKLEAEIATETEKKTKAAKEDDREAVKRSAAELKNLRLQLAKARSKSPEEYAEDAAERTRIAAEKKRKEEEQERLNRLLMRDGGAGKEQKAGAGFPMPEGVNAFEVVYAAQGAVKAKLKNPAGAKFPGVLRGVDLRSHCKYNGDGTYTVISWVDATNSFGAQLRVHYVATVEKRGNAWNVSDIVLVE